MKSELVLIYTAQGMLTANLIKSLLEAEGIDCLLAQEGVGAAYGLSVGVLGEVKMWVRETDAEEAKKLIEEMRDADET
jgi:hypothetical protein